MAAAGTIKWFADGLRALSTTGAGGIHLANAADVLKMGIVTGVTPTIATAVPAWGAGGSTNYATSQVTPGGNYATGGPTLGTQSWTVVAGVPTFRADDITISQHASNFTNGRYAIFYSDTSTNKLAFAFMALTAADADTLTGVTGDIVINFQGAGTDLLTITQS